MPKFTDLMLRNLPIPEKGQITHNDEGSALKVRVSQGGAKTFFVTLDGSGTRHTIGRYPDVSLADARTAAKRMRAEKTLGRVFQAPKSLSQAQRDHSYRHGRGLSS